MTNTANRRWLILGGVAVVTAVVVAAVAALTVNIFAHKQEAKNPYVRLVDVTETTTDPAPWGSNWPRQYDGYKQTVDTTRTRFGGSEALPEQKAKRDPWLTRMFAGYAFAIDFRDRRGHAYMLSDQEQTKRVTERPQPGACLHCHASIIPTYRRVGEGDVMKGFEALSQVPYAQAHAELVKTGSENPVVKDGHAAVDKVAGGHPVSCVDCHDPKSMELRVTRPGFIRGIAALARSNEPVPHIPSLERWRKGDRAAAYDPNQDSTRQEMRSFVCGQCHVEYYCGPKVTLFFPWDQGLKVEQIEKHYEGFKFPDGHRFFDWKHAETGAEVLKAQHPEFEMWSQGVHARSGVACADCHMPYKREGAMKVSDHWVRSPLLNVARACQVCHPYAETELQARVDVIQERTHGLMNRAAAALTDMLDAVVSARKGGAAEAQLAPVLELQRKAQWRLDFVAAENSMGFHAPAEAARILGEAIDYARQGQNAAAALINVAAAA
ncbi:MAG TPA: ammonia-forming cytochrome c nitrite reductase subunit c552, partial [Polyangia bacterium]